MEKLSSMLDPGRVILDLEAHDAASAIAAIVAALVASGRLSPKVAPLLEEALRARERDAPTALGRGIAVPHAYLDADMKPVFVLARTAAPIPFNADDGLPVDTLFLLAGPTRARPGHLGILARIAGLLGKTDLAKVLRAAKTPEEVIAYLESVES